MAYCFKRYNFLYPRNRCNVILLESKGLKRTEIDHVFPIILLQKEKDTNFKILRKNYIYIGHEKS